MTVSPAADIDVFVSYSHSADRELARDLERALARLAKPWNKARALRVFRDDSDLAAATSLDAEITRALERSRYFLLLASPESARSPWVRKEVEFWKQKRSSETFLIAVTDGAVAWKGSDFDWSRTTALPTTLSGYFRREPIWVGLNFARSDPDERMKNRASLRDDEFRSAVASLAAGPRGEDKKKLDDHEQRQHRVAQRVRRTAVVALALLTVASLVAGFSALRQATIAENRARVSSSRALAAQAIALVATNPRLATHLALHAYRVEPTSEARSALATVVQATAHFDGYLAPASDRAVLGRSATNYPANDVAISGDGRVIAAYSVFDEAADDNLIHLYDTATLREIGTVPDSARMSLALDHDGDRLLSGGRVWDVPSGQEVASFAAGSWWPAAAISASGRWVAATERKHDDGLVRVIDATSGAEVGRYSTASPTPGVRFAADDSALHVVDAESGAASYQRFDLGARQWAPPAPIIAMPTGFADPDESGTTAVVLTPGNEAVGIPAELQLWDLRAGLRRTVPAAGVMGMNLATTSDNRFAAVTTEAGGFALHDTASGTPVTWNNPHAPLVVTRTALSDDGERLVTIGEDGAVVLHTRTGRPHQERIAAGAAAAVSADGRIGLIDGGSEVLVRELATGVEHARLPGPVLTRRGARIAVDADSDLTRIAILVDGQIHLWDNRGARQGSYLPITSRAAVALRGHGVVRFLADETHLLVSSGAGEPLVVLDTRTQEIVQTLAMDGGSGSQFALSPDRRTLAVLDFPEIDETRATSAVITVQEWDETAERFVETSRVGISGDFAINDLTADLVGFTIAADRTTASIRDSAGRVHLVDLSGSGAVRRVLEDSWSSATTGVAVFDDTGAVIAVVTALRDGPAVTLWDAATGQVLARWPIGSTVAQRLVASGDGMLRIVTGSGANSEITGWQVGVTSWKRTLCAKVRGDRLTADERGRYLSGIEVAAPCPG